MLGRPWTLAHIAAIIDELAPLYAEGRDAQTPVAWGELM